MDKSTATTQPILLTEVREVESLVLDSAVRGVLVDIDGRRIAGVNALYEDDKEVILQELVKQALSSSASVIIV
jgi:CRISPR/Cas system CMR subunit Cmr4 (Cas7 group RAMP superfamily)